MNEYIIVEVFSEEKILAYRTDEGGIVNIARMGAGFRYDHFSTDDLLAFTSGGAQLSEDTVELIKTHGEAVEFSTPEGFGADIPSSAPSEFRAALDFLSQNTEDFRVLTLEQATVYSADSRKDSTKEINIREKVGKLL